jgi:hypothetical protein
MNKLMKNIKLHYLYRDGSNYKKWGEIIFCGTDRVSIESVTKGLRDAFLPDGIFVAHQVRIPEVFLASDDYLTSDDHCYHEFDSVEETSDSPTDPCGRSIREFMSEVATEADRGWRAFDPQDRLISARLD